MKNELSVTSTTKDDKIIQIGYSFIFVEQDAIWDFNLTNQFPYDSSKILFIGILVVERETSNTKKITFSKPQVDSENSVSSIASTDSKYKIVIVKWQHTSSEGSNPEIKVLNYKEI